MPFNPPVFRPDPSMAQVDTGPSSLDRALDLIGQRGSNMFNLYTRPTREQNLERMATGLIPEILREQQASARATSQEDALDKRLAQQIQLQEMKDKAMAERQQAQWEASLEKTLEAIRERGKTPYQNVSISVKSGGGDEEPRSTAQVVGGPHTGYSVPVPTSMSQVGVGPTGLALFTTPSFPGDTLTIPKKVGGLTPALIPTEQKQEVLQQKRVDSAIATLSDRKKTRSFKDENEALTTAERIVTQLGGEDTLTDTQKRSIIKSARARILGGVKPAGLATVR